MNRQFDNLTSGFYQLSHATKYGIGVVLTTKVIITRLGGVVKVLGENFMRGEGGRRIARRAEKGNDLSRPLRGHPPLKGRAWLPRGSRFLQPLTPNS